MTRTVHPPRDSGRTAPLGARARARRAAIQALYQWQVTGQDVEELSAQFLGEPGMRHADVDYFAALVAGVTGASAEIDELLAPLLDRPIHQVDPVERAILRMGAWELRHRGDIPWRVAIDEAVELARTFGAEQGHRYVNGVLDRLARGVRAEPPSATT